MAVTTAGVVNELLRWRFMGAAVWHGLAFTVGYTGWALAASILHPFSASLPLLSFAATFSYGVLLALQLCALITHRSLLSASEAPTVYSAVLGIHSRGWLGIILSRVILRTRHIQDFFNTLTFLATMCSTAITTLFLYPQVHHGASFRPGFTFSVAYGISVGGLYTIQHLARCRDVLSYPVCQRHRALQLRQRLPACLVHAAKVSITAFVLTCMAGYRPGTVTTALGSLSAATLCVWGWLAGHAALEVVSSEPLKLTQCISAAQDPVRVILEAMGDNRGLVQDLTLQDLVTLSEGPAAAETYWRSCVWQDDSGALAWNPLAVFLTAEVKDWISAVSQALPGAPGAHTAGVPAQGMGKVQWNMAALSGSTGTQGISRAQDKAAWVIRAKFYKVGFCLRALSSLAASSRREDRYGVVLMCEPKLGDVTLLLLSFVLTAQQYVKSAGSSNGKVKQTIQQVLEWTGPPSHPCLQQAEVLCYALEDLARGCVYRLVSAFGPALQNAVQQSDSKPPYGAGAELSKLLAQFTAYKE